MFGTCVASVLYTRIELAWTDCWHRCATAWMGRLGILTDWNAQMSFFPLKRDYSLACKLSHLWIYVYGHVCTSSRPSAVWRWRSFVWSCPDLALPDLHLPGEIHQVFSDSGVVDLEHSLYSVDCMCTLFRLRVRSVSRPTRNPGPLSIVSSDHWGSLKNVHHCRS